MIHSQQLAQKIYPTTQADIKNKINLTRAGLIFLQSKHLHRILPPKNPILSLLNKLFQIQLTIFWHQNRDKKKSNFQSQIKTFETLSLEAIDGNKYLCLKLKSSKTLNRHVHGRELRADAETFGRAKYEMKILPFWWKVFRKELWEKLKTFSAKTFLYLSTMLCTMLRRYNTRTTMWYDVNTFEKLFIKFIRMSCATQAVLKKLRNLEIWSSHERNYYYYLFQSHNFILSCFVLPCQAMCLIDTQKSLHQPNPSLETSYISFRLSFH